MTAPYTNFLEEPKWGRLASKVQAMSSEQHNILSFLLQDAVGDAASEEIKNVIALKGLAIRDQTERNRIALEREELDKTLGPGGIEEKKLASVDERFYAGLESGKGIKERELQQDFEIGMGKMKEAKKGRNLANIIGIANVATSFATGMGEKIQKEKTAKKIEAWTEKYRVPYAIGA